MLLETLRWRSEYKPEALDYEAIKVGWFGGLRFLSRRIGITAHCSVRADWRAGSLFQLRRPRPLNRQLIRRPALPSCTLQHEGARGKLFVLDHPDNDGRPVVIMRPR